MMRLLDILARVLSAVRYYRVILPKKNGRENKGEIQTLVKVCVSKILNINYMITIPPGFSGSCGSSGRGRGGTRVGRREAPRDSQ